VLAESPKAVSLILNGFSRKSSRGWIVGRLWLSSVLVSICLASLGRAQESGEARPPAVEKASWNGWAEALSEGPSLRAGDGAWELRPRLILAVDGRRPSTINTRAGELRLDQALLGFDARYGDWLSARVLADARGTDTDWGLDEAWIAIAPWQRRLRLSLGLQKLAIGLEHSLPEFSLPFVDTSFPAFLTSRSDLAARLDGELADGLVSYEFWAALGQGFGLTGRRRSGLALGGRATIYPFRFSDWGFCYGSTRVPLLGGFFGSVGLSYSFDPRFRIEVESNIRNPLFKTPGLDSEAAFDRHLGYGMDWGPFRILHEFTRGTLSGLALPDGERVTLSQQITAWSLSVSWRITGEAYDSRPYRQREARPTAPKRPLWTANPEGKTGLGMIELALRYANADIDRQLIELGFTNEDVSPQEFRAFDAALTWAPVQSLKISMQVSRTIADSDPLTLGSQGRDTSFFARLQLVF
jgi:hypothetical protein